MQNGHQRKFAPSKPIFTYAALKSSKNSASSSAYDCTCDL